MRQLVLLASMLLIIVAPCLAQDESNPPTDTEKPWYEGEMRFPWLESGHVGELPEEAKGETKVWGRKFPIFAQDVIDLGYELPNPYGFGAFLGAIDQDVIVSNLEVGLGGAPAEPIDFVTFTTGEASHEMIQTKADLWLFPFMNLFIAVGHVDGTTEIPLSFPGDEALKFLVPEIGRLCDLNPGNPLRPQVCDQTISVVADPDFSGQSVAFGTNLAMGWDRYFAMVNLTYATSEIDIVNEDITGFTGSARLGITGNLGDHGDIAIYIGGMYLDTEIDLTGRLVVPTGDDPLIGDDVIIDFKVTQKNADKWNYLFGFNWDLTRSWAFNFEVGYGGSRKHLFTGATYRW